MKLNLGFVIVSLLSLSACGPDSSGGGEDEPPAMTGFQLSDDRYDAFGNTPLEVGVPATSGIAKRISGSLLDNDRAGPGGLLTVTAVTPGLGSVAVNPDGGFTYVPPAGLRGSDSFSYEASDGSNTASAEVIISLDAVIWYVDNRVGGASGTSSDAFGALLDAQSQTRAGDSIYIAGDGSSAGLDAGLALGVSDVNVIGAGVPLVVDGVDLAAAGIEPVLLSSGANIINLEDVSNVYIAGLRLSNAIEDAVRIRNGDGITLAQLSIENSGASAIEGDGARVDLNLLEVNIINSDQADASRSDDAVFIHADTVAALNMQGGGIDAVPGRLGDGILLQNTDSARQVDMTLIVRAASFSNIAQDAIKVDNENGLTDVTIGGSLPAEGNSFSDIGFRGIVVMNDGDSTLRRRNRVTIGNNVISAAHEGIQIRGIDDVSQLIITDNSVELTGSGIVGHAIDLQQDNSAQGQARIRNNRLFGNPAANSTALRVRLFDGASLALEAADNSLDSFDSGFALASRQALAGRMNSRLDSTVTNNSLININLPARALRAINADANSETCLDLRNNSAVSDYVIEAVAGVFDLALGSQAINLLQGTISDTPAGCRRPVF